MWARLATRGSAFANGDTLGVMIAFESGATAVLTAILATPFIGRIALYGSQGWMEIRDRTHPEHPTGWDVTVVHRGGQPGDALPAAASRPCATTSRPSGVPSPGEAPYPVSLEEIAANVCTFEAITRSALSGKLERVYMLLSRRPTLPRVHSGSSASFARLAMRMRG